MTLAPGPGERHGQAGLILESSAAAIRTIDRFF